MTGVRVTRRLYAVDFVTRAQTCPRRCEPSTAARPKRTRRSCPVQAHTGPRTCPSCGRTATAAAAGHGRRTWLPRARPEGELRDRSQRVAADDDVARALCGGAPGSKLFRGRVHETVSDQAA